MTLPLTKLGRDVAAGYNADGTARKLSPEEFQRLFAEYEALLLALAADALDIEFPYGFINATNGGAGTPNAIVATTDRAIPAADGGALIALPIVADNDASPVTVTFNGGATLTIKNVSGEDVSIGGLTAGMVVAGYVSGGAFRLLSDQASAAVIAQAQAAQAAAETARDEAVALGPDIATVAQIADDVSELADRAAEIDAFPAQLTTAQQTLADIQEIAEVLEALATPIQTFDGDNIGNMTAGGGLAAAFDGIIIQTVANSAQSTSASTSGTYDGKTYSAPRRLSRIVVHAPSDGGFLSTGATCTIRLYGKNGAAPASFNDGTLLANTGSVPANASGASHTLINPNPEVAWQHIWAAVVPDGNTAVKRVAELQVFVFDQATVTPATTEEAEQGTGTGVMRPATTKAAIDYQVPGIADARIATKVPELLGTTLGRRVFLNLNHATTDQTAAVQAVVDAYNPAEGPLTVQFGPGTIVLNGGGSDVPLKINKPGLTFVLSSGTVFKKTVANRLLMIVGSDDAVSEGNWIEDFEMIGGTIDGNSVADTTDDYATVNFKYVKRGRISKTRFKDCNVGFRAGRGPASFAMANRRAQQIWVENCVFENCKWFGVEMFGVDDGFVLNNVVKGGAATNHGNNVGIRVVSFRKMVVDGNIIDGTGQGIGGSTDAATPSESLIVANNIITNMTYGYCCAMSGPHVTVHVTGNQFLGFGTGTVGSLFSISTPSGGLSHRMIIANNILVGVNDNSQRLMELNGGAGDLQVSGNTFNSVGVWSGSVRRCLLLNGCNGLTTVIGNTFNYDGTQGFGIEDSGGVSGSVIAASGNVLRGVNVNTNKTRGIRQVSSSGTLVKDGGSGADMNIYIDR